MSFMRWPLWQQLMVVWLGVGAVAAVLLWNGTRRPWKFFYILPTASFWRAVPTLVVLLFRTRPVVATAVVALPLAGIVATLALLVARITPALRGGVHAR